MISSKSSGKTLSLLREWMAAKNLTCYIVPSADNHQGEYVAACDERRAFVSDFDGSSGTAVIGMEEAMLWTDARYFIQAQRQLSDEWSLKKMFIDPPMIDYLCHHANKGSIGSHVGIDPTKISIHEGKSWSSALRASGGELHLIHESPVDAIWEDRPELPSGDIFAHDNDLVGLSFEEKREHVISALSLYESSNGKPCKSIFLTALPEIAWLFNLRGSDVLYTPIFWAYAYLSEEETVLFTDEHRMEEGVAIRLKESSVSIRPYAEALDFVSTLGTTVEPGSVYTDPSTCNYGIFHSMRHAVSSSTTKSPVAFIKSIKTPIELQGFRNAHLRDGAALSSFFAWMEEKVQKNPKHPLLTEVGVSQVLETQFRGTQPRFVSLSFETIVCIHSSIAQV
jgi:Xaa-Pro aminopeptidase